MSRLNDVITAALVQVVGESLKRVVVDGVNGTRRCDDALETFDLHCCVSEEYFGIN